MLIESVEPANGALLHSSEANCDHLIQVTGIIRRRNFDPQRPVNIPGCGRWKVLRVDIAPVAQEQPKFQGEQDVPIVGLKPVVLPPRFLYDPDVKLVEQDDLESQHGDVDMDEDTDRELDSDEDSDDGFPVIPVDALGVKFKSKGSSKKLPKGTSEYQADWLLHSDSEESENKIIGSDEELESDDDAEGSDNEYDEESMDWDEEKKQMLIAKGMCYTQNNKDNGRSCTN